jgi:F-box-like
LTINHLPDEVLLEIFDSYRQGIDPESYDHQWRRENVWFNLAHVCRRWRAVMFTSASRLDLGITIEPDTPRHIKAILSGPLPIFIYYRFVFRKLMGSALWRMRTALKHHDRVREINFRGGWADFNKFFKKTNCTFPVLESLVLSFEDGYEPKIPDTFLGGPDLSYLPLRRLQLERVSLACVSRLLLSATALTDLTLQIDTAFSPSHETSLLACLQGMHFLRRLDLQTSYFLEIPQRPPTPKDIVSLPKLTCFRYFGNIVCLDILAAGLSAPSLQDVDIDFPVELPIVHLSRLINEIEEHYHAVHVTFHGWGFHLSLLTQSEYIDHCEPHLKLGSVPTHRSRPPGSILGMTGVLSARLTTVEELRISFDGADANVWEDFIPWRRFLLQFPGVKALRTEGANNFYIARIFLQDHEELDGDPAFLPALEEIELGRNSMSAHESERGPELAAFKSFVSARQQEGRPVNVFFSA